MNFQSTDAVLVENLSGVKSPIFKDKTSDDVLSIYKIDNDFNLDENSSPDEIVTTLSREINCNPDGWLVFISNQHQKQVKKFIKEEFLDSFNNEKLNFSNGEIAETIIYHNVSTGVIIEMIDPECTSDFFSELIEKIEELMESNNAHNKDFLAVDFCHMSTHMHVLDDCEEGVELLKILAQNNINY